METLRIENVPTPECRLARAQELTLESRDVSAMRTLAYRPLFVAGAQHERANFCEFYLPSSRAWLQHHCCFVPWGWCLPQAIGHTPAVCTQRFPLHRSGGALRRPAECVSESCCSPSRFVTLGGFVCGFSVGGRPLQRRLHNNPRLGPTSVVWQKFSRKFRPKG